MATLVVVPLKRFARAKARLSPVLDEAQRAQLAERLAEGVVGAAATAVGPERVLVVTDEPSVVRWAEEQGVRGLVVDGDLDAAAAAGLAAARADGCDRVLVAHGDLVHPEALVPLILAGDPLIAPDRHLDGTNVLAVPTAAPFPFAYGPASFDRHLAGAAGIGLDLRVVVDSDVALDVDTPDDLRLHPQVELG